MYVKLFPHISSIFQEKPICIFSLEIHKLQWYVLGLCGHHFDSKLRATLVHDDFDFSLDLRLCDNLQYSGVLDVNLPLGGLVTLIFSRTSFVYASCILV